jgi:TetR/AcrR family transcriptional repressor of nem operon
MPPNAQATARSRSNILAAAGRLFRRHGYDGVGIDTIMAEAGLTRGTFYAHFASKADLFAAVVADNWGLCRQMAERPGDLADRRGATRKILDDYLNPAHLPEVAAGCTLAALAGEAPRAEPAARHAYTEQVRGLLSAFAEDCGAPAQTDQRAVRLLLASVGAVTLARAVSDPALAAAILSEGRTLADEAL